MPKPDSLTPEPAAGLNRRGLLAAVGGVAAAGALSTSLPASAAIPTTSADIIEARRIVALMDANDRLNAEAEDEAAMKRADIATLEGDRICSDFIDRVLATPVRSLDDVVVRAIIAGYWLHGRLGGDFSPASLDENIDDYPERLTAATVLAVLALYDGGGANVAV
jgi:hypothetical protein